MSTQPTDAEILELASQYWYSLDETESETEIELVRAGTAGKVGQPAQAVVGGKPVYQASYKGGFWQDSSRERHEYLKTPEGSLATDWELRVLYTAPQPVAEPAPSATAHVGDSLFESWFSEYNPAHRGTKQQMRDAYAAGMGDPKAQPSPTPQASRWQAPAGAGEMEVFGLQWPGEDRINLSTVFDTEAEALEYMQNRCDTPGIRLVRFSSKAPTAQAADSVPAVEREQERIAFKDAHRYLDLDEVPDAWGRPMFKHSHVESSWLGWIVRASLGNPAGANENAKLVTLIAECRDAFPIPAHGDPIENYWSAAIEDPSNVPAYLQEIAKRKQAGSVQDDSARLDWLLLRVSGAEFRRIGVHYSGNARRADVDAARKEGGAT